MEKGAPELSLKEVVWFLKTELGRAFPVKKEVWVKPGGGTVQADLVILREVCGLRLRGVDCAGPQQPGQGLDPAVPALCHLCSPQSSSLAPTLTTPPQPEQGLEN